MAVEFPPSPRRLDEPGEPTGAYLYRLDNDLNPVPRQLGAYDKYIDEPETITGVATDGAGRSLVVYTYDKRRLGRR